MALRRRHFADPHVLLKTEYSNTAAHVCDICRSKMAGLTGYRCIACDFDIHEACADYFKQTISFFAHPWHDLTLSRLPTSSSVQWSCDLCMEVCPPGDLVYRCTDCLFDVHPLCAMLPQNIRSPLHPRHDLRLVPSAGMCMCGCEQVSLWNYVCSCPLKVNIACAGSAPSSVMSAPPRPRRQAKLLAAAARALPSNRAVVPPSPSLFSRQASMSRWTQQPAAWHRRCSQSYQLPSVDDFLKQFS